MQIYQFTLFILSLTCSLAFASTSTFRLHLNQEPSHLDPNKLSSSNATYLLSNLYRNLLIYDNNKGLTSDLAEECLRKDNTLTCKLKKNLKWSDGTALTSQDFADTYRRMLDPKQQSPRADLLFSIENAEKIYKGELKPEFLGVQTPNPQVLIFQLKKESAEFEYNLSTIHLVPTKAKLTAFNGPYKLKSWERGKKLILESNKFYVTKSSQRPVLEYLFIEEDSVALQLYEKGQLDFLRRLPTLYIPSFKKRKDFHWIPVIRFDYFGFGPELQNSLEVRQALTYSLNYEEWQKIFSSEGRPGCAGLPDNWFPKAAPCFEFNLKKIPKTKFTKTYDLVFSSFGGDDHKRAAEWMQNQWQIHAHIKTRLIMQENKTYLQTLRTKAPAIFRKGLTPDRPTCLAALETFSQGHSENFIQLHNPVFEDILQKISAAAPSEKKKLCQAGVKFLMDRHLLIPTGRIHFSILASQRFTGWKLNEINQLDLSDLRPSP